MDITKLISPQNADEEPSNSASNTPTTISTPAQAHRHRPSTPAMDTLAKAAAMASSTQQRRQQQEDQEQHQHQHQHQYQHHQHHQHQQQQYQQFMRNASSPSPTLTITNNTPSSLTPDQRLEIKHLNEVIRANRYDFSSRLRLISLLHDAFTKHVFPPNSPDSLGNPHTFEFLDNLLDARQELDQLFAINEQFWEEWIQEKSLLARTIEERVDVLELCRKSVDQEYGSPKLWCIYGDWILYLHETVRSGGTGNVQDKWTQEDIEKGREVFLWESVVNVWESAAEATRYRINDSHLVWDKYIDLLTENLQMSPTAEKMDRLRSVYVSRLQTPHQTWDKTWQQFSTFISTYYEMNYEPIMVDVKAQSATARTQWDRREFRELALKRAVDNEDSTTEYTLFVDYINWELSQERRHHHTSFELICAIYERALLRFPCDIGFWNDYILFVIEEKMLEESRAESRRSQTHRRPPRTPKSMAPALDRATRHCPWSGTLWSQYILSAEREYNNFEFISYIKHRATSTGVLEAAGIGELAKVWTTYCSYLHRRAFEADSTDEHHGMAEVGIRSALEDLRSIYEKNKSNGAASEALFRLERMYIQYLSDTGSYDTARERFKELANFQGHNHEFWLSYYFWELQCWAKFSPSDGTSTQRRTDPPGYATAVLKLALNHAGTDLDWPERIISVYLGHCEDYESADEMQIATIVVRKALRDLDKRRQKQRLIVVSSDEAVNTAAAAAAATTNNTNNTTTTAAYHENMQSAVAPQTQIKLEEAIDYYSPTKRKREDSVTAFAAKRARATPDIVPTQIIPQQPPKRDRENASVIARGFPADVAVNRVKYFFRDCGRMKSVKILPDSRLTDDVVHEEPATCATAVVEFEMYEDALSALTRDQKVLDGNVISVQPYVGATIYLTNFPPEKADDKSMRELLSPYGDIVDIRFPSLRYNPHRRFCYVQFASADAAHRAVAEKHGTQITCLDGKVLQLYVQISNPMRKNERHDAGREGREIHVSNLIYTAEEKDLRELFEPCGRVESVRVPKKVDGSGKGFGFVVFDSPEAATSALSMENTVFRGRELHVRLSTAGGAKHSTTAIIQTQGNDNDETRKTGKADVPPAARTIALMNVPDTVNDARIRSITEKYGPLVKLTLRPDHAGAIIEFVNENDAGRSSLGLEGTKLDGQVIHVGSVKEMLAQEPVVKEDAQLQSKTGPTRKKSNQKNEKQGKGEAKGKDKSKEDIARSVISQPAQAIRRPGRPANGAGRRGGLGIKRFSQHPAATPASSEKTQSGNRSNDDFRAMLEQARSSQQKK